MTITTVDWETAGSDKQGVVRHQLVLYFKLLGKMQVFYLGNSVCVERKRKGDVAAAAHINIALRYHLGSFLKRV